MRRWLSDALSAVAARTERFSFWLSDLSLRVRYPRRKPDPSTPRTSLAMSADGVAKNGLRPIFEDLCAVEDDIFRDLPFKEP